MSDETPPNPFARPGNKPPEHTRFGQPGGNPINRTTSNRPRGCSIKKPLLRMLASELPIEEELTGPARYFEPATEEYEGQGAQWAAKELVKLLRCQELSKGQAARAKLLMDVVEISAPSVKESEVTVKDVREGIELHDRRAAKQ